jgi:hypothetical protein
MEIMDRLQTQKYLINKLDNNERIVLSRYNDGEYLLMTDQINFDENSLMDRNDDIGKLLNVSIKHKNQLVCVNYLKEHNIKNKDKWYEAQKYLTDTGGHDLYGCGNYFVQDFIEGSPLLKRFFEGKVLLVTAFYDECTKFFENSGLDIAIYQTSRKDAAHYRDIMLENIKFLDKVYNYNNILISAGPISKVLVADLADTCNGNIIDLGSGLNAIIGLTDVWKMSWIEGIDVQEKIKLFKEGIWKE